MAVIETVARVMKSFLSGFRTRWEKYITWIIDFFVRIFTLVDIAFLSGKNLSIDRKSSHRNPDKKAVSTNVKIRTKNQINHVMYFSHLVRIPDKKDLLTRATVSVIAFSGQNSDPPVLSQPKRKRPSIFHPRDRPFLAQIPHLKSWAVCTLCSFKRSFVCRWI